MIKNKDEILYLKGDQVAQVCEVISVRVGSDTLGYQTQYSAKVITLSVWIHQSVSLERFVTS